MEFKALALNVTTVTRTKAEALDSKSVLNTFNLVQTVAASFSVLIGKNQSKHHIIELAIVSKLCKNSISETPYYKSLLQSL